MATPFSDLNFRKASDLLGKVMALVHKVNRLFYSGDHFQNGQAWIGPQPEPTNPNAARAWQVLKRIFVSKNAIAEVTNRHTSGVVGRELRWGFSEPNKDEDPDNPDTERLELEESLTKWIDIRGLRATLMRAVATLLLSERASLRVYIPLGFATVTDEEDGSAIFSADTFEDALNMIYVDHPAPEDSRVYVDEDTKRSVSILRYWRDRRPVIELTYLDGEGNGAERTVVKLLARDRTVETSVDIGQRLLMYEMERPLFITPQIQQAQMALNVALTNIPKTIITSGWMERTLLNAQMPGVYVDNPETGQKDKFIPHPYVTGPNTTSFVQGITYKDEEGKTILANPSLQYREPIPATASIEAKDSHYADILDEADQSHVRLNKESDPSGISRIEARQDYIASLRITQAQVELGTKWLFETVVALAEELVGSPGLYTSRLRCTTRAALHAGPLSPEEQQTLMERVEKGLIPKEWAMELMGVDDVDAAAQLMRESPESKLDLLKRQFEVMAVGTSSGLGVSQVARLIEFDEEQMKIINEPQDPVTDPTKVIEQ